MKVWKAKAFARWARKEGLDDDDLLQAADEIASGRFEGDRGGDVVKKRVARAGEESAAGFGRSSHIVRPRLPDCFSFTASQRM